MQETTEKMSFPSFVIIMKQDLEKTFGEGYVISVSPVRKNNNLVLTGMVIRKKNSNTAPTIYLEEVYESYMSGRCYEDAFQTVLNTYEKSVMSKNFDASCFTNWDNAKSKICMKLINAKMNQELLKEVPHVIYLDLAIVFYYVVEKVGDGMASILIKNEHMDDWGVSIDDLYGYAKCNSPKEFPYVISSMYSVIQREPEAPCMMDFLANIPMFVITNQNKVSGAVCVLYDGVLDDMADAWGVDIYIIPSSVHECILIPDIGLGDMRELSQMVREVNQSQLMPEEILSDHAYYYSRKTRQITM